MFVVCKGVIGIVSWSCGIGSSGSGGWIVVFDGGFSVVMRFIFWYVFGCDFFKGNGWVY